MMNHTTLSEEQISTVVNGLRVAAERFDEHIKSIRDIRGLLNSQTADQLVRQFERQAVESRQIASLFERSQTVRCTSSSMIGESAGGSR